MAIKSKLGETIVHPESDSSKGNNSGKSNLYSTVGPKNKFNLGETKVNSGRAGLYSTVRPQNKSTQMPKSIENNGVYSAVFKNPNWILVDSGTKEKQEGTIYLIADPSKEDKVPMVGGNWPTPVSFYKNLSAELSNGQKVTGNIKFYAETKKKSYILGGTIRFSEKGGEEVVEDKLKDDPLGIFKKAFFDEAQKNDIWKGNPGMGDICDKVKKSYAFRKRFKKYFDVSKFTMNTAGKELFDKKFKNINLKSDSLENIDYGQEAACLLCMRLVNENPITDCKKANNKLYAVYSGAYWYLVDFTSNPGTKMGQIYRGEKPLKGSWPTPDIFAEDLSAVSFDNTKFVGNIGFCEGKSIENDPRSYDVTGYGGYYGELEFGEEGAVVTDDGNEGKKPEYKSVVDFRKAFFSQVKKSRVKEWNDTTSMSDICIDINTKKVGDFKKRLQNYLTDSAKGVVLNKKGNETFKEELKIAIPEGYEPEAACLLYVYGIAGMDEHREEVLAAERAKRLAAENVAVLGYVSDEDRKEYTDKLEKLRESYNKFIDRHENFIAKQNGKDINTVKKLIENKLEKAGIDYGDYNIERWAKEGEKYTDKMRKEGLSLLMVFSLGLSWLVEKYFDAKKGMFKEHKRTFSNLFTHAKHRYMAEYKKKCLDAAIGALDQLISQLNRIEDVLSAENPEEKNSSSVDGTNKQNSVSDSSEKSSKDLHPNEKESNKEAVEKIRKECVNDLRLIAEMFNTFKERHGAFIEHFGNNEEALKGYLGKFPNHSEYNIDLWGKKSEGVNLTVKDDSTFKKLVKDCKVIENQIVPYFDKDSKVRQGFIDIAYGNKAYDVSGTVDEKKANLLKSAFEEFKRLVVKAKEQQSLLTGNLKYADPIEPEAKEEAKPAEVVEKNQAAEESKPLPVVPVAEKKESSEDTKKLQEMKDKYNKVVRRYNAFSEAREKFISEIDNDKNKKDMLTKEVLDGVQGSWWDVLTERRGEFTGFEIDELVHLWSTFLSNELIAKYLPESKAKDYRRDLKLIKSEIVINPSLEESIEKYNLLSKKILRYMEAVLARLNSEASENGIERILKKITKHEPDRDLTEILETKKDVDGKFTGMNTSKVSTAFNKAIKSLVKNGKVAKNINIDDLISQFSEVKGFKGALKTSLKSSKLDGWGIETGNEEETKKIRTVMGVLLISMAYLPGGSDSILNACDGLKQGGLKGTGYDFIGQASKVRKEIKKQALKGVTGDKLANNLKNGSASESLGYFINVSKIPEISGKFGKLVNIKASAVRKARRIGEAMKGKIGSLFGGKDKD